jgi:hypothetical protein
MSDKDTRTRSEKEDSRDLPRKATTHIKWRWTLILDGQSILWDEDGR